MGDFIFDGTIVGFLRTILDGPVVTLM